MQGTAEDPQAAGPKPGARDRPAWALHRGRGSSARTRCSGRSPRFLASPAPGPTPARSVSRGSGPFDRPPPHHRPPPLSRPSSASQLSLLTSAALRTDERARRSQKTPGRAGAREAGHRRSSERAAAAGSRRAPLRNPITQPPSSASRVGGRQGRGGGCGEGAGGSSDASCRLPVPRPSDYTATPLAKTPPEAAGAGHRPELERRASLRPAQQPRPTRKVTNREEDRETDDQ